MKKIEEGVDFSEAANTPIPGGEVVNISYLLILRTGGTGKAFEQWEDMHVSLKTWQDFKEHLSQTYRIYQISKKETVAEHGYGASENNTQETDAQVNTADALQ